MTKEKLMKLTEQKQRELEEITFFNVAFLDDASREEYSKLISQIETEIKELNSMLRYVNEQAFAYFFTVENVNVYMASGQFSDYSNYSEFSDYSDNSRDLM